MEKKVFNWYEGCSRAYQTNPCDTVVRGGQRGRAIYAQEWTKVYIFSDGESFAGGAIAGPQYWGEWDEEDNCRLGNGFEAMMADGWTIA